MTETPPADDPSEHGQWRPWRLLQAAMDADIARVYAETGVVSVKPGWVMELLRLNSRGSMTITELADSVQLTHSAISQKVKGMRAAGLVTSRRGTDARSKRIALTPKARRIVGKLAAEWRATEATIIEIESEIPYPLSRVVPDIQDALRRKSFHDRIVEKLERDTQWR